MKTQLTQAQRSEVDLVFGERARFDQIERLVYSHDMGVMPDQVTGLINSVPDGVVQPISVEELKLLVGFAAQHNVPLVPRGAGTAGFGGSVPARGGIVVDFIRMNKIIAIDNERLVATVEPGVIWSDLETELNKQGLALCAYPSSSHSSTAAGWVAQGGSGYGSYEYGEARQLVEAVEVLLPNGRLQRLDGEDIDKVYGCCGITGLIVQLEVKLREKDEEMVALVAFADLKQAGSFLTQLKERQVPLWNVSLATPAFTSLKQKALEHYVLPEDAYLITLVYPRNRRVAVEPVVQDLVARQGGRFLKEALAQEEWQEKFYPMRFKKLGPTLVASEVVVPVEQVAAFVERVEKKFEGAFALEGTMINPTHISILGFMLSDVRKLGFPLAYACALDVIDIGEKLGGRVFSIGMYFADRAVNVLGPAGLDALWNFKQLVDPSGIMNPGKVLPTALDKASPAKNLAKAMQLANAGKTLIGLAGRLLCKWQSDDFTSPVSAELTDDTYACALCGYCREVCTVFKAQPWESNSPRGKYYLLQQYIKGKLPLEVELGQALFPCTTCKRCDYVCQIGAHNAHNWMNLRYLLGEKGLENTGLGIIRANVLNTGNFWGIPAEQRLAWLDVPAESTGKLAYWSGCWAGTVMDNMAQNATRILNKLEIPFVHFGERERCCGLYLALGGYEEDFKQLVKRNLEMFEQAGIETILFSCPGCYATFSENYPAIAKELGLKCNIRFKHIVVYLSELIAAGKLKFAEGLDLAVTYHDSCHVGRWFGHYEEPRNILKAMPGVELREMAHSGKDSLCCGLVSAFDSLPTSQYNGVRRVVEAEETGAQALITNCAGCGSQFNATCQAMGTKVKQVDLTELVAKALGLPTNDPTEKVGMFMAQCVQLLQDSKLAPRVVPPIAKK